MIRSTLLAALALVALAAGTATATTMTVSPGGSITAASLGKITWSGGALNFRCNLTLSGSLATSVTATSGTHAGAISRVEAASCEGGNFRSFNNLPWEVLFQRLTETGVELLIREWSFSYSGVIFGIVVECTYRGDVPTLLAVTAGASGLLRVLSNTLSKTAGSSSCPASVTLSGTFSLEPQQTITLA